MLLHEKFKHHHIILASQSPRRRELLSGLDIAFDVIPLHVDESYPTTLRKGEITEFLCHKKASAFSSWQDNTLLITADTIVWMDNQPLEKPLDAEHAIKMLSTLSGKTHEVISSFGVFSRDKTEVRTDITEVTFGDFTEEEIQYYVQKYKPYDKAGSYGVQEWIGYMGVKEMKGSYFNVMGLSVYLVYNVLKEF